MKQKYNAPWGRQNHDSHCKNIEYNKVYPTGSNAGKLYGTAKFHRLPELRTVDQLPLRPIVSNIVTASYYLGKHLAKILATLTKSEYTVQNTKDFVSFITPKKMPSNHHLILFGVVSLFTNVPIDLTIDIIIRSIYEFKEIDTSSTKNETRQLILLCTKMVISRLMVKRLLMQTA